MITFDIDEQESGKYLVYYKQERDEVDSLVMGMMENNKIEGTVPFVKVQVDTVVSYRYDITGLQPLNEYFSGIVSKNKILTVIEEILNERTLLEEYMLDLEAAVLESKYMFVDPATGHVKLLLLPVKHNNLSMDMFFRSMIFSIQYDPAEDVSYVTKILNYFNGAEIFTMTGFAALIRELKGQNTSVQPQRIPPASTPVNPPQTGVQIPPCPPVQQEPVRQTSVQQNPIPTPPVQVQMAPLQNVPPVQPDNVQDPGTTVLNGAPVGGNVQHYVNPNLTRNQNPAPLPVQSHGVNIPKTYPGTSQSVFVSEPQQEPKVETAPVKEKKGLFGRKEKVEKPQKSGGLFGKKEKPEYTTAPKVETPNRPRNFRGVAIPGSDVVPQQENTATTPTAIPAQNVSMQVHAAPIQNFGETVDLQSYTNATQGTTTVPPTPAPVKKPCLIRKSTREQFVLTKEMTRVGRSRENVDIYITDNTSIGRVHAVLYLRNGRVYVEDQNSKNGTFLNGHRVSGQEELIPGARLSMSNEEFEIAFL